LGTDTLKPKKAWADRGPKPTAPRDWLFGYAPRRMLLTELFGPGAEDREVPNRGLSAAQLAAVAGKCRSGAKADIEALEALGLITRRRVGQRDRYFPVAGSELARSICLLIEAVERVDLPAVEKTTKSCLPQGGGGAPGASP
jgi:hypothetical protein